MLEFCIQLCLFDRTPCLHIKKTYQNSINFEHCKHEDMLKPQGNIDSTVSLAHCCTKVPDTFGSCQKWDRKYNTSANQVDDAKVFYLESNVICYKTKDKLQIDKQSERFSVHLKGQNQISLNQDQNSFWPCRVNISTTDYHIHYVRSIVCISVIVCAHASAHYLS